MTTEMSIPREIENGSRDKEIFQLDALVLQFPKRFSAIPEVLFTTSPISDQKIVVPAKFILLPDKCYFFPITLIHKEFYRSIKSGSSPLDAGYSVFVFDSENPQSIAMTKRYMYDNSFSLSIDRNAGLHRKGFAQNYSPYFVLPEFLLLDMDDNTLTIRL